MILGLKQCHLELIHTDHVMFIMSLYHNLCVKSYFVVINQSDYLSRAGNN